MCKASKVSKFCTFYFGEQYHFQTDQEYVKPCY